MRVVLVGLNHRTAPVHLREQLAIASDDLPAALGRLRQRFTGIECAMISTCNRTELYIARPADQGPSVEELRHFLAAEGGVDAEALAAASIHREQEPAVRHLFRVAAGLDSMVLGEPQILGQVKRAYEAAVDSEAVGSLLHQVFQQAIALGKQVRHQTHIGQGNVSVGSVAVDFARQIFEDLSDKSVLNIGVGEMTKPMLRHLLGQSPRRLWLVNRTPDAATALAEALALRQTQGGARPWDQLDELLVESDIVLTGTSAAQPIITPSTLKPLLRRRRNRPLLILDLAMPRDVEPTVGALTNVFLYNLDDLQAVIDTNQDQRAEAMQACETHLNDAVHACMAQIQHQDLGQLVRHLRQRLHAIGDDERARTRRKLGAHAEAADPDKLADIVDEHTHRVINKILHLPLSQLDNKDAEAPLGFYAAALRRLFQLEDAPGASQASHERLDQAAEADASEKQSSQQSVNEPTKDRWGQRQSHSWDREQPH
jgi:glutamyl-tRNA reductase